MSELYSLFASEMGDLDFSDEALLSLYNHESYGTQLSPRNGFAVGKQYLNVQVTMWREDLRRGWIFKHELYSDERAFHIGFLDSALGGLYDKTTYSELLAECEKI